MAKSTPTPAPLIRVTDFADQRDLDPLLLLDKLVEAGADVFTRLPGDRYYTHYTRVAFDPFEGRDVQMSDPEVWLDLAGWTGLMASDVAEMARTRSPVAVQRVMARWGEVVTVEEGGPVTVTLDALSASSEDLHAAAKKLPKPPRKPSQRDIERRSLGADMWVTLRRAAELLPGDDQANRRALKAACIVRDRDGRKMVRWGDVAAVFPTEAEQAETDALELEREAPRSVEAEPRRRKPRPRKGGIYLADLD